MVYVSSCTCPSHTRITRRAYDRDSAITRSDEPVRLESTSSSTRLYSMSFVISPSSVSQQNWGGRLSLHEQFRPLSVGLQPLHKCKQFVSLLSFPMHLGLNSKPKQIYHGLNRIMDTWIRRWRIHVSMIRLRHDIFVLAWNWDPDRSETIKVIQIEFGCSVLLTYLCSFNVNLLPRCMAKYSTNCFLFLTRILH